MDRRTGWARPRGRAGAIAATAIAVVVAMVGGPLAGPAEAAPADPRAEAFRRGLVSLGELLEQLGEVPAADRPVPLTPLHPLSPAGLDDDFLTRVVTGLPDPITSTGDLVDKLEARDFDAGEIRIDVGCPRDESGCATPVADITPAGDGGNLLRIPIVARRQVTVPYVLDPRAGGGVFATEQPTIPVDLSLRTTLSLYLAPTGDPDQADMAETSLTRTLSIVVEAAAAGRHTGLGRWGVADVDHTVDVRTLDDVRDIRPGDPDPADHLTQDEWESSDLAGLLGVSRVGRVDATVIADARITGARDVRATVIDDLANGFGIDPIPLGRLAPFGLASAEDLADSLGHAASAVDHLTRAGNLRVPFLGDALRGAVGVATPVATVADRVAVRCTDPDGGAFPPADFGAAAPGRMVLCRAMTSEDPDPGSVRWSATGAQVVSGTTDTATVGTGPRGHVQMQTQQWGPPAVEVTYTVGGQSRRATTPPLTAERLGALLASIGSGGTVRYIPPPPSRSDPALGFRLQHTSDPARTVVDIAINDELKDEAGLFGVGNDASADRSGSGAGEGEREPGSQSVYVDPGEVRLDGEMQLRLAAVEPEGPTGAPATNLDRVSLAAPAGGQLLTLAGLDVAPAPRHEGAPSWPTFRGLIGFLEVAVEIAELAITKRTGATHLLGVGLGTTDPVPLARVPGDATVTLNADLRAGLDVVADAEDGELGRGRLDVTTRVDENGVLRPAVSADTSFLQTLRPFHEVDPDNPQALLGVVLDSLDRVAGLMKGSSALAAPLPFVALKPADLLAAGERLSATVAEVRAATGEPDSTLRPLSIQHLESIFEDRRHVGALGLGVDRSVSPPQLVVDLSAVTAWEEAVPMSFRLGESAGDLFGVEGQGLLAVSGEGTARLDLGIPLGPTAEVVVRPATGLVLRAGARADDIGFAAHLGGFEIHAGRHPSVAETSGVAAFGVVAELTTPGGPLSSLTFAGDVRSDPVTCRPGVGGAGCAVLSVVAGHESLGDVTVTMANPTGPPTVQLPADFQQSISALTLDWTQLLRALPALTGLVATQLQNGAELPLIGGALAAGADAARVLSESLTVSAELEQELRALATAHADNAGSFANNATAAIGDALGLDVVITCGGATCSGPLRDVEDMAVALRKGDGGAPGAPADGEFLHSQPFELGLPGLPLVALDGALETGTRWGGSLTLGLSRDRGPYFQVGGAAPEFHVDAAARLGAAGGCPAPPPVSGLTGYTSRCLDARLGFLEATLWDAGGANRTQAGVSGAIDVIDPSGDGYLTMAELRTGQVDVEVPLTVTARVDLLVKAGTSDRSLPSVIGRFQWQPFATDSTDSSIRFTDLHLDVGDFVHRMLGPVVSQVQGILGPIGDVIAVLRERIPVLSDVSEFFGEDPVTLLSFLPESEAQLVHRVIEFIDFAANLPASPGTTLVGLGGGSGDTERPGSFTVDSARATTAPVTADRAASLVTAPDAGTELLDRAYGSDESSGDSTFGVTGLTFPALADATRVFELMMGSDVDLVKMDFGTMRAGDEVSIPIGPLPILPPLSLKAEIFGGLELLGRLSLGYDTAGLRRLVGDGRLTSLLSGLYIDDYDDAGADVDELAAIGTIGVRGGVSVFIGEAGVQGKLTLQLGLDLNDPNPDGKVRAAEMEPVLDRPLCLFSFRGRLDASAGVYASLIGAEWVEEFARVRLLDFRTRVSDQCGRPVPARLATYDPATGRLTLNVTGANDEFAVTQLADRSGPGGEALARVEVTSGGLVEQFPRTEEAGGVTEVFAPRSAGHDRLSFTRLSGAGSPNVMAKLWGGLGDDTVVSDAACSDLEGGPGRDTITGGPGFDRIIGADQEDIVDTGRGASGDEAEQFATGCPHVTRDARGQIEFHNVVDAGNGDDAVRGGSGRDNVITGNGDDVVDAGPGDDVVTGNGGDDRINGGPGSDRVDAGVGNDAVLGGLRMTADDSTHLDGGDTIIGGAGNDTAFSGDGDDVVWGDGRITDTLVCRAEGASDGGHDVIEGGAGADRLRGGFGDDVIFGGNDGDNICGNGGLDYLEGDGSHATRTGDDHVDGGPGGDTVRGGNGRDDVIGGRGNDGIDAGEEIDAAFGDDVIPLAHGWLGGTAGQTLAAQWAEVSPDQARVILDAAEQRSEPPSDCTASSTRNRPTSYYGDGGSNTGTSGRDRAWFGDSVLAGGDGSVDGTSSPQPQEATADQESTGAEPAPPDDEAHGATQDSWSGDSGTITLPGSCDPEDADPATPPPGLDRPRIEPASECPVKTPDADCIDGGVGGDLVRAQEGDDIVWGGPGIDEIFGNTGDDTIAGNGDRDGVRGGDGRDTIFGDAGILDVLIGDSGADLVYGGPGRDTIGGDGESDLEARDTLYGQGGDDKLFGQPGDDTIVGASGWDVIQGGFGIDVIEGGPGQDSIEGSGDDDTISGGDDADNIDGGVFGVDVDRDTGNDTIDGGAGNDTIALAAGGWGTVRGGQDDDDITGGPFRDVLYGDAGDDVVKGLGGNDDLWGGTEADSLYGGPGADHLRGEAGTDRVFGDADDDTLYGGNHTDLLYGGTGTDQMRGGAGNDTLKASAGNDRLFGESGDDSLYGGDHDDYIEGGVGRDRLSGGPGWDAVDYWAATGPLRVTLEGTRNDGVLTDGTSEGDNVLADVEQVSGGSYDDRLVGDSGPQRFRGRNGTDVLEGLGGDDVLDGGAHADGLYGSSGNDRLLGGPGDDLAYGESGDDQLWGHDDDDTLSGGTGADVIRGGAHDDVLRGGSGADTMLGESGADDLAGGEDADALYGGTDPDRLAGGGGHDRVDYGDALGRVFVTVDGAADDGVAGEGDNVAIDVEEILGGRYDDRLVGGTGSQTLRGRTGRDFLNGRSGDDHLYGGADYDFFKGGSSHDRCYDSPAPKAVGTLSYTDSPPFEPPPGPYPTDAGGEAVECEELSRRAG